MGMQTHTTSSARSSKGTPALAGMPWYPWTRNECPSSFSNSPANVSASLSRAKSRMSLCVFMWGAALHWAAIPPLWLLPREIRALTTLSAHHSKSNQHTATNTQQPHNQCAISTHTMHQFAINLHATYNQSTTSLRPDYNQTTTNPQPACRVGGTHRQVATSQRPSTPLS